MSEGVVRTDGAEPIAPRNAQEPQTIDAAAPRGVIAGERTAPSAELDRAFDDDGLLDATRFAEVEQALAHASRWSELLELYAAGAQRAPDAEIGRRLLLSAGLLCLEKLGDPRAGEPWLRRVLASDPTSLDALDGLRALALHVGRFEEAADLFDRSIAVAPEEEKAALLIELAALAQDKLHQPDRAIEALRYAYAVAPGRPEILALARRIFIAEERWADAKRVLDDEAAAVLGKGDAAEEDARAIAEAHRQLGVRLLESALFHGAAEECLERARSLGDQGALSKLDELAHLRKDWEGRAKALRDEAIEARDKKKAAALYLRAAELYHAYGKDPIRAEEYLDRCLLLSPGFPAALRFIEATHLEQRRLGDLLDKLSGMAVAVKDPAVKVELLLRIAQLLESEDANRAAAGAPPNADTIAQIVGAYRRALAIDPGHRLAVTRLSAILSDQGQHADRAQVLEGLLAASRGGYLETETHLELGRLYAEMLGDSARARAHFEAVLALEPTHFEAASALRALYKDGREQALLLSVLKALVDHSPDLFSRLELLYEIGRVAAGVSREEEFAAYRRIFELDPNAAEAEKKLEELAHQLHRYQVLADAYAAAAQRRGRDRSFSLWLRAARLYDTQLPRPEDAIRAYQHALAFAPDNREIQDALERLLRQQDDPRGLVSVLTAKLERNTDPQQTPLLLAKIGAVLDRDLGDLDGAIAHFNRVLELVPNDASALLNLDDLYRRSEGWADLERILVRREALAESASDLADLEVRRARLLDERLDRKEDAAQLYLEVLAVFPDHAEVIHALLHLMHAGILPAVIARALEPVFAQRGQFTRQLEVLRVSITEERDPRQKRELARRAAAVAEVRLHEPGLALELAREAVNADPSSEEARELLLRLAHATGRLPEAAVTLEMIGVRAGLGAEVLAPLASALGELYDGHLSDRSRAIEWYRRALAADGGNAAAIAALERLLGAERRFPELATLLEERISRSADPAAKVNLGMALASVRSERLNDVEGAINAYREVLQLDSSESTALARLAGLLEHLERFRELLGVLDRMSDTSQDPELKSAIDVKVAEVLGARLRDRTGALERLERAITRRPGHEGAVRGLEVLLDDVELRARAGALLEAHYERAERWRELVLALESQLIAAAEPGKRRATFLRIAMIETEKLGQHDEAFETLARAHREGLLVGADQEALRDAARRAHRARELAQLYEDSITSGVPADPELPRELARLYDGDAADPVSAKRAWERLLERRPNDPEALGALERLHAAGDNPAALAEVLLQRADASPGAERVAYLKRASAIYEEAAEDLDRAILAMERAAAEEATDRSTWQELQRLYALAQRPARVRDAVEAEATLVEEPLQRANLLVRLAELSVLLGRQEDAVGAYQSAIAAVPSHEPARAGLEKLLKSPVAAKAALALEPVYRALGDWAHLVEVYELLASASKEPKQRVERLVAIRSIYEERLGRLDRAFGAAARAFKEDPSNEELLQTLERLGRLSGEVDELLGMFEDYAEQLPYVSEERAAIRVRIARSTETLLHDRARSIEAWRRVLEERPDSLVGLQALERLYTRSGDARELVEVLRTMAGLLEDPAERTVHLRRAATILEEKLGERTQAARVYEHVLTLVPNDVDVLRRLDVIYTETRQFEELSAVLAAEVAAARTGEERGVLYLRLGELRRRELQDPKGALAAFAAVLRDGPEAAGRTYEAAIRSADDLIGQVEGSYPELAASAAELLEPCFAKKGDFIRLVRAKEVRVTAATDPAARRALRLEIAQIYEGRLAQPEMAFLTLSRAYGEAPGDPELVSTLERLSEAAETEEELAELFAQALPAVDDEALVLRLARKVAHLYDLVLERGEAAVPFYNRVLALVPDDAGALRSLERIYKRAGNAEGLVEVYRTMLRLTEDRDRQKVLWRSIAQLSETDLANLDGAFEAYRAMLAIDAQDPQVLRAMAALCERADRLQDLAIVLAREAEVAVRPDERAQTLLRLATLKKDRLQDPLGAVEIYSRVLELRREDPGAIAGLAAVAREGGEPRAKAAAALAPVYLASGAFSDYIACLEAQLGGTRKKDEKKGILIQIAEVYEQKLGRPEHAFTYSCRALHEDLLDGAVRARVERLAEEAKLYEDLAAFYLDEIDAVDDHDLALALRRRVADIYDHELQDVTRAIQEHTRVLDVAPGDTETLKSLERLYRSAGSFGSLAEVYRRRIAQTDDNDTRATLLREFARLQAEELGDSPGAIATLRRLLELEPSNVEALGRLAKLCKDQGRASELSDVLARLIGAAPDGSAVQLDAKHELARLKAEKLGDLGGADTLFREVLIADPTHEATREYLQERMENALAEDDAGVAEATGEMLADALRASEEWNDLISVLRMLSTVSASAFERVRLSREIATVYRRRLKKPELAFQTLAAVYKDAPGVEEVRQELEELAEELLMYEDLVRVLESGLDSIPDSELALSVERRIAQHLEKNVGDRERAATAWQRVLARRPMDAEALEAMDRLNLALGRWGALCDVLEKRIELAEGDDEALHELYVRSGSVWDERLGEKAEAIDAYRRARALKPRDRETLQALSRLLDPADVEVSQELYAVLEALSEDAKDRRELVRLLPRMAALAGGPLERPALAIDLWKRVISEEPQHAEAQKSLDQLYEVEGRWQELAAHLDRQLQLARDEKEVLRLQRRLGFVKGTRLGSVEEAVRSWSEILKRNPNDIEALNALRQIYRDAKRWEELVATLRKLIPLQLDAQGVKTIRFELAEVFLTNLNLREEAIESAKRVLDVDPHTEAELMRLEEIFIATAAYGEAVKVMNARVELADDPKESEGRGVRGSGKIDILFEIAQLYETKIGRRAGAASAYERVLSLDPTSVKAYDSLAGIYESNGDYRKLVELHNRRLESTEDVAERKRLLFSIIDIQERWLGQPELAFSAACRAFAEEGADAKAQEVAERLADETDNWEILAEVFEEQIDQVGVGRSIELRRRLAEVYVDKLQESARAEQQLDLVLSSRPDDETARALLMTLLESQGRWRDLIAQVHDQIDRAPDVELKKQLFRRIAKIEEEKLSDIEGAISSHKRVLDLDPEDQTALLELVRIFRQAEKWHPLISILTRQLELAQEPAERIRLRYEIATVWESGIEDSEHAIEGYRDVLVLDADHLPSLKALERLFTQLERWIELVDVYERQVALAGEPEQAIQLLGRIAGIWEEEFRDLEGASSTLIRVLEIEPEHLPTVKSLERIWREAGDFQHLIEAHQRHIELTQDKVEIVGLQLSIGEIYVKELGRSDKGEAAYRAALELDGQSKAAIHALGQLYERAGNWYSALDMLNREAQLAGASAEAVELHFRMGKINEEKLVDRDAAKVAYQRALELEPGSLPAMRALRNLLDDEGSYAEVVALLSQEAEHTTDKREKALLYQSAAETAIEELDEVEQGTKLYEKSLESSPDHVASLRALADLYFGSEEWAKAEKLLERLIDRLDRHDDLADLCKQNYRLAYIAEKLDDDHRALKRYLASYELDSTYLPTLEGLAAALLRAERWEDAQRIFQTILIHHKGSLTDAEVVDLHFQIGELAARLEQLERAKKSFEKALDLDQDHVPTLRAYAKLAEALEEWEQSYDLRERLIDHLEGEERFSELMNQARLCRDRIQEPYRAIDAFAEARREKRDDPEVLRALVALFEETSQAGRTIEVLLDLEKVIEDAKEKRDIFVHLARIYADEQKNVAQAVHALNRALDLDPMHIDAFKRIEELLFNARQWPALEENYHRMIQRMPKEQKAARIVLWTSLGGLYERVLKNDDGAKVAYEVVLKLNPESIGIAMKLAGLLAKSRETAPKAVALYHEYLPQAEDPSLPTRKLFELYSALGQLDRAFASLGALMLMRAATPDEQKAYALLLKKAPTGAKRSLTDNLWRTVLLDPACRSSLADISSVLYRGAPDLFGGGQRALILKKKERVDLSDPKDARLRLRYFHEWQRLSNAMHVGEMDHYHRAGATPPRLFPGAPPVLFVGEAHEVFKEMPPRQIAWLLARQMATARPELSIVRALPPDEVACALEAAIQLFAPDGSGVDLKLDARVVGEWMKALRRTLSERALKALRDPVVTCLERREMKYLARFIEGAEHSASRAALLMAGDVVAAEKGLADATDQLVDLSYRARVRALILFSMSEDYFILREKLGLAIGS